MSTTHADVVELSIPSRPEFVGVARLAILGVASRMRFSYDEVEDIRLAVGEACTTVLDRAEGGADGSPIRIRCAIEPGRLVVEVRDQVRSTARAADAGQEGSGFDESQLGSVLIRILMDDVSAEEDPETGAHVTRMIKYVAR